MRLLKMRHLKKCLAQAYPVHIVLDGDVFWGCFPDLPDCQASHASLEILHQMLDTARQQWLAQKVFSGQEVPKPNSNPHRHILRTHKTDENTDLAQSNASNDTSSDAAIPSSTNPSHAHPALQIPLQNSLQA